MSNRPVAHDSACLDTRSIASRDLWREVLHHRNLADTLVTVEELRDLIAFAERGLEREAQGNIRRDVACIPDSFWHTRRWVRFLADADLTALAKRLRAVKQRLQHLIEKRTAGAVNDHIWITAMHADADDEAWRRVRITGSPIFGDGSRYDALRVHASIKDARQAWYENVAAGHGVWGSEVWA